MEPGSYNRISDKWEGGRVPMPNCQLWPGAVHVTPVASNSNVIAISSERNSAEAESEMESAHTAQSHPLLSNLIRHQLAAATENSAQCPPSSFTTGSSEMKATKSVSNKKHCAALRELADKGACVGRSTVKDGAASSMSCGVKRLASRVPVLSTCGDGLANQEAASRVRARRGEATDQHSIAERTRRTKITERMRSLHRLIPDASKTNKASMMDEVIQYVTTLQARLKMESTRKLDPHGDGLSRMCANAYTDTEQWRKNRNRVYVNKMIERVLDPQEERLAEVERQVTSRLSHPSCHLSLASTYLASLGLTLLPISRLPLPQVNSTTPGV